jgi:flavorubredoxin
MPVLEDLKGLRFRNKIGAGFCTYGWSGESLGIIEEHLKACGLAVPVPGVKAMWQPGIEDLARCEDLGRKLAKAMG